ncbi:MAG TPA: hypothetical protein VK745_30480 [Polyangiaceae bacterium]|nr:hypothetical protein [Polyangiaceae bacterium]
MPVEAASLGGSALAGLAVPDALVNVKATLRADSVGFCRDVGVRLPAALESVSSSEIRQYLGPFLEQAFRAWAERENDEVHAALEALSRRFVASSAGPAEACRTASAGPDSRLTRPALEVSTFALDASVVASLAIGLGALFTSVAVGGLFLLAAPTLAAFGRERGERALRKRADEAAMKAVEEAVRELESELERVIDDFARRIAASSANAI